MIEYSKLKKLTIWEINIIQFEKLLNILGVQIISKKLKNKFENQLSNNSAFVISLLPPLHGGKNLERRNVERAIFRNFKIANLLMRISKL